MPTLSAFSYYCAKCLGFVAGANISTCIRSRAIIISSFSNQRVIIGQVDIAFALMAFPTVISALLLSLHVKKAAIKYFSE